MRVKPRVGMFPRAVVDVSKSAPANGKPAEPQVEALRADVQHELRYRIAPQSINESKLYESVAYSVHNRLVEGLEATNDYWRCGSGGAMAGGGDRPRAQWFGVGVDHWV